jgi:ATP-dependent RNA helicase DeaD
MDEPPSAAEISTEGDPTMSTLFVNLGRRDGTRVGDILRLFETHARLGKDDLGRIRIRDRHTFVGVPKERAASAVEALAGRSFGDKALVVEIARAEQARAAPPEPGDAGAPPDPNRP